MDSTARRAVLYGLAGLAAVTVIGALSNSAKKPRRKGKKQREPLVEDDGKRSNAVPLSDAQQQAEAEKVLGNEKYKQRKFTEAIAHYGKAIELVGGAKAPGATVYLLNRAAAHLEGGDPHKCIHDCARVVEIFQSVDKTKPLPPGAPDQNTMAKVFSRMGAANLKLGKLQAALTQFRASQKAVDSAEVRKRIAEVTALIQSEGASGASGTSTHTNGHVDFATILSDIVTRHKQGLLSTQDVADICAEAVKQAAEPYKVITTIVNQLPPELADPVLTRMRLELLSDEYFSKFPPEDVKLKVEPLAETGRGLIAQRDFPEGSSVVSEFPLVSVLDWNVSKSDYCSHCLRSLGPNDTKEKLSSADPEVYCGRACRTLAWDKYYKHMSVAKGGGASALSEIGPSDALASLHRYSVQHRRVAPLLILRSLARMTCAGEQSSAIWDHLDHLVAADESASASGDDAGLMDKERQLIIDIIKPHKESVEPFLTKERYAALSSKMRLNCLRVRPRPHAPSGSDPSADKDDVEAAVQGVLDGLIDTVTRAVDDPSHPSTCASASTSVPSLSSAPAGPQAADADEAVGVGLYLISSYVNHSCSPNVTITFPDGNNRVVMKALKPINAGDEVVRAYVDVAGLSQGERRAQLLAAGYDFLCLCPVCKADSAPAQSSNSTPNPTPEPTAIPQPIVFPADAPVPAS